MERLNEGQFYFDGEKALDIKKSLNLPQNVYTKERSTILLGQKLLRDDFEVTENGRYWVDNGDSISIFEFDDEGVHYLLNRVSLHEEL